MAVNYQYCMLLSGPFLLANIYLKGAKTSVVRNFPGDQNSKLKTAILVGENLSVLTRNPQM